MKRPQFNLLDVMVGGRAGRCTTRRRKTTRKRAMRDIRDVAEFLGSPASRRANHLPWLEALPWKDER